MALGGSHLRSGFGASIVSAIGLGWIGRMGDHGGSGDGSAAHPIFSEGDEQ